MGNLLEGKRLLIVEDEYWVARELADFVEDRGGEVVVLTGRLDEALDAAEEPLHGALVDLQLGDGQSYPLIDKLRTAGVPIILITGYHRSSIREDLRDAVIIAKPFKEQELEQMALWLFRD